MTLAKHLDPGLDRKEAILGRGQGASTGQEVARDRLRVAVGEGSAGTKRLTEKIVAGRCHGRRAAADGRSIQGWLVGGDEKGS